MAKVNIIVSVYNQGKFIKDSINSIINQRFTDFQLIIINDGSTDNSEELILSFTDKRISYHSNEVNKGLIYSLNLGIDIALNSGCEYIARMDSDDIALPNRLEEQVVFLDQNPDIGLLGCAVQFFGSSTKKRYTPVNQRKIIATMYCYNPFFHPTVMFRKELVTNKRYDYGFPKYEDYGLWIDLIGTSEFHNLPTVLVNYRQHEGSETSSYKHESLTDQKTFISILKHLNSKLDVSFTDKELEMLSKITSPSRARIDPYISLPDLTDAIFSIYDKTDNAVLDKAYLKQLLIERALFYLLWNGRKGDVFRLIYQLKSIKEFIGILKSLLSGKKWVTN